MQTAPISESQTYERGPITLSEDETARLHRHLNEVLESTSFRASHRGGQFLKYILEQTLAGHLESLKERVIGMELFGRSSTYDTGEDAIVRVTASDVRKRLNQHYEKYGATSEFRISLPPGSYIPVVTPQTPVPAFQNGNNHTEQPAIPQTKIEPDPLPDLQLEEAPQDPDSRPQSNATKSHRSGRRIWYLSGIASAIAICILVVSAFVVARNYSLVPAAPRSSLLWSSFFASPHAVQIVMSDPNIAEIEGFTGGQISISDYANHKYIPDPGKLSPEVAYFCNVILRGDKAAAVDVPIANYIGQMAYASSKNVTEQTARSVGIENLARDSNFVFLGSPRTNPWFSFFNDQLDFRFVFDDKSKTEFIRNIRPHPKEADSYLPTAPGWATGRSFATIALVKNPGQIGQVLLIAGETGEGTDAAGRLLSDTLRLNAALKNCGVTNSPTSQQWQLILQLNAMAGSPINMNIVACHLLDRPTNQ